MKRAAALVSALALSACAGGPGSHRVERAPDGQRVLRGYNGEELERTPNPSALVAGEIAFAHAAREDGQWTAFRSFAADDAVMFVPGMVPAKDWLASRDDPPAAAQWQPHLVVMSCDGRTGATTGALQRPDGSVGYYTRVWHRPNKRGGQWEWVLSHGDTPAAPRPEPDFVKTQIANCKIDIPTVTDNPLAKPGSIERRSDDRTIIWRATVGADGSRVVTVDLWTGSAYETVIGDQAAAPVPGAGAR